MKNKNGGAKEMKGIEGLLLIRGTREENQELRIEEQWKWSE